MSVGAFAMAEELLDISSLSDIQPPFRRQFRICIISDEFLEGMVYFAA